MTPLYLALEGLYSYQTRQEIDFKRLTQAELFGIFGSTGSGKSSILEAISFALYGRTERLNRNEPGGGTAYHMMNLKSNRLFIDFQFLAGKGTEERYRFTAENRRHKTVFDKTQSFVRKAYQWVDEAWFPLDIKDATTILGLSYDHFKRTLIIPQGKFEEFIQLKSTDRSKMLQDIFKLEKYELSGRVRRLQTRNSEALSSLQGRLSEYTTITQEALAANRVAWEGREKAREEWQGRMHDLQKEREQQDLLRQRTEQLAQHQQRLTQHLQQQAAYAQRQQNLDRYIRAKDTFGIDLSEKDRLARSLTEIQTRLGTKTKRVHQVEKDLAAKQKILTEARAAYEQRDELLREAEEWERILSLKDALESLNALESRVQNGVKRLEQAEQSLRTYQQQHAAAEERLTQLEQERPDQEALLAVEKWLSTQTHLADMAQMKAQQLTDLKEQIVAGKEEKTRLARQVGLDTSEYELSTAKMIARLEKLDQDLTEGVQNLEREQVQAALQHELNRLSDGLKPGTPCPLCGATEHPGHTHPPASSGEHARIQTQLTKLKQEQDNVRQTLTDLRALLRTAKALQPRLTQAQEAALAARQALDTHQLAFVWAEYRDMDAEAIAKRIAKLRQVEQDIEQQRRRLKDLRDAQQLEQDHLNQWRPELDRLRQEWNQLKGQVDTRIQSLTRVSFDEGIALSSPQLYAKINQRKQEHQNREAFFQEVRQQTDTLAQTLATLGGEIRMLEKERQQGTTAVAQITQHIEARIEQSGFAHTEEVRAILDTALNIDAERDAIRDYERRLTELETTLRDLQAQVGESVFDVAGFEALQAEILQAEAQVSTLNEQIGGHKAENQRLTQALKEKTALQKEEKTLQLRADNLKVMEGLFRANGFVNYISTSYLENLCAAANERFLRLNHNSLHLEIDAENHFYVRDLLNGGRRRSIKTLSGGQTFQAALCLALALSDQVQQQVQAEQNFFFLDEGFGSQDKESLHTIFQTLKSLRKENRIVGVISHVEELQQEIETFLRITNDSQQGSQVKGSWTF